MNGEKRFLIIETRPLTQYLCLRKHKGPGSYLQQKYCEKGPPEMNTMPSTQSLEEKVLSGCC